jgi:hypothetical protein
MTFQEARAKLAEISGGKYRALYYELVEHTDGSTEARCRVYVAGEINGSNFSTWQEAIDNHIKAQLPIKNADVADMPE